MKTTGTTGAPSMTHLVVGPGLRLRPQSNEDPSTLFNAFVLPHPTILVETVLRLVCSGPPKKPIDGKRLRNNVRVLARKPPPLFALLRAEGQRSATAEARAAEMPAHQNDLKNELARLVLQNNELFGKITDLSTRGAKETGASPATNSSSNPE